MPRTALADVEAASIFDPFSNSMLPLLYTTIPCCSHKGNCSYANCNLPSKSLAVDNLFATPIFARHVKKKIKSKNLICVAPDVGGTERARALGKLLNVGLAIVDKRRPKPGQSQVMNIIGDVKGKTCILVDDIIDSGGTIVNAAKALKQRGAKEVYVYNKKSCNKFWYNSN